MAAAAAAYQSLNNVINPFTAAAYPSMAADPLPTDIPRTIPFVDCLRSPFDHTAFRGAKNLPRIPLLCAISDDRTTLIAEDCLSNTGTGAPIVHRIPLPAHLQGHEVFGSIGHCLLLEKEGTLAGIRIFNPFSPSPSSAQAQVACLPPSASLMPKSRLSLPISPEQLYCDYQIHTVVTDTKSGIALALLGNDRSRVAYTRLDRSGVSGPWIDLTSRRLKDNGIFFRTALLYKDGLFCAVDYTGTKVYALDFSSSPPEVTLDDMTFDLPNNRTNRYRNVDWCCFQSASLVNTGSSLFLVRWRTTLRKDCAEPSREMDVFRLHDCSKKWVRVKSLGGHSFFIGNNNLSISMSTADFPELKSNQVYVLRDAFTRISGNRDNCHYYDDDDDDRDEFRFHLSFNLEDDTWGLLPTSQDHKVCRSSVTLWMMPPPAPVLCESIA